MAPETPQSKQVERVAPKGWLASKLGNFMELKRGYDLPASTRDPGRVPVISSSGPSGTHGRAMVKAPGVVTGRYGTIGQVYYAVEDFWPLNTTLYVRDFKGNDPRFVSYFLRTVDFYSCSDKAAVPGVNRNHLHELEATIPPLPEQRAIAHILGTLDDKIELNRRTNETLEAMARALFKSWFVDFDPVHAKKAGRKPEGMDAETAALFPDDFEDSEMGKIPRGWSVAPLESLATAFSGGTPSKQDPSLWNGPIPWVSPKAMGGIHVDSSDESVTPRAIGNGTRLVGRGSTLVMVRGMGLHQSVRVSQALCDVTFNQDVKALVARQVDPTILFFGMLDAQSELLGKVETSGHGTGKLPSEILLAHRFVLPSTATQSALAKSLEAMNRTISAHGLETRTLAALRDALLPQLLSGSLRVPEAMRLVEKVI